MESNEEKTLEPPKNFALLSKGASLERVTGACCHSDISKLLRIDELGFGDDVDAPTERTGGNSNLNPGRERAGWKGDHSTYFTRSGTDIIIKLDVPTSLTSIGFMDTPWDRNYGRQFECFISETGCDSDWTLFGTAEIPSIGVDRGEESRYCLRNIWVQSTEDHPPQALYVKYCWPRSNGKRIFHLYAFGFPANLMAVTVRAVWKSSGVQVTCESMGGSSLAVLSLAVESTIGNLRLSLSEHINVPAWKLRLVLEDGAFLSEAEDSLTLDTFLLKLMGVSPKRQDAVAHNDTEKEEIFTVFRSFDSAGNGTIDRVELSAALQALDPEKWNDKSIDKLFCEMDTDANDKISMLEMLEWVYDGKGSLSDMVG